MIYNISPYLHHNRPEEDFTILDVLDYLHVKSDGLKKYVVSATGYLYSPVSVEEYMRGERDKYLVQRGDTCLSYQYNNNFKLIDQDSNYLESLLRELYIRESNN